MLNQCPLYSQKRTLELGREMSALCHVWTAPSWQGIFSRSQSWSAPGSTHATQAAQDEGYGRYRHFYQPRRTREKSARPHLPIAPECSAKTLRQFRQTSFLASDFHFSAIHVNVGNLPLSTGGNHRMASQDENNQTRSDDGQDSFGVVVSHWFFPFKSGLASQSRSR
jgi:hypothetical protein